MQSWLSKYLKFLPLHLGLWVVVWLFYVYFFSYASDNSRFVLWFSTSLLPVTMVTTYVISYYIIPTFLVSKKYKLFALYIGYTVVCSVFLIVIVTFLNFIFQSDFDIRKMPLLTRNFVFIFILVYIVVGIVSFVRLLRYQYEISNKNRQLENKLLEGQLLLRQKELKYLKQQIQPHFLFNTLNTLYGFALRKSEETPELILKLSQLMDYMLYQMDKPYVALSEEIKHLEAYIGLEKVRFRDRLRVHMHKNIHEDIQVPPMLFLAFIENAFKHGEAINDFLDVTLLLTTTNEKIHFEISNTLSDKSNIPKKSHGIGLHNAKKRLDTLYPNAYTLDISQQEEEYKVRLTIQHTAI
jgi:sensor histidine kinase YesM